LGKHGRFRLNNSKCSQLTKKTILKFLKMLCSIDPTLSLFEYKFWLNFVFKINYSLSTISKMFTKNLKITYKKINQLINALFFGGILKILLKIQVFIPKKKNQYNFKIYNINNHIF